MKGRLPIVLSVVAVVIAAAGYTSLGEAAREALPRASFAANADKVDGIHASRRPRGGRLYPLGRNGKFPAGVLTLPATGVSGLEVITAATATDSSPTKSVTATCSAGKRVIGGGARVTGAGATDVAITETYPPSTNQWTAFAREINAVGGSWNLGAYAICAA